MLLFISITMAAKKNSIKHIDPSNSLWALKRYLSSKWVASFDFNSQQDLAEILQVVLDELKGVSLAASSLISKAQFLAHLCFSVSDGNLDILLLQVPTDIQNYLNQFLSPEILSSQNKLFFALHARLFLRVLEKHVLQTLLLF